VLHHPGVQAALVVGVVSVCEHSLQSKAQAEWQAKKDKIRADRRSKIRAAAEMVLLNSSSSNNAAASASRQMYLKMDISDDMAQRRRNRSWWEWLVAGREPLLDEMEIIA
jgi:hypothetical protein